jgi:tetraacyldisaccharide 4'-kinase
LFPKGKPRSRALLQITEKIPPDKNKNIFFCTFEILGAYTLDNPIHVVDLSSLKQENVLLLSSIGDPESFTRSLSAIDIHGKHKIYPDHFLFTETEIATLTHWIEKSRFSCIVTTEKDAVKLRPWKFIVPCYVIEMELVPPPEFIKELEHIIF